MTYSTTTLSPPATVPCPNGSSTSPATEDQSWSYGVQRMSDYALVAIAPDYQTAEAIAAILTAAENVPKA